MMLQCGQKYGFSNYNRPTWATLLHLLTYEELTHVPRNNTPSGQNFSVFDRKGTTAKCCSHMFKAKSIHNGITLHKSPFSNIPDRKVKKNKNFEYPWRQLEYQKNVTRR